MSKCFLALLLVLLPLDRAQAATSIHSLKQSLLRGEYWQVIKQADALIMQKDTPQAEVLYYRGLALVKLGRYEEALTYFDTAAAANPSRKIRARLFLSSGDAWVGRGEYARAEESYREFVRNYPHDERAATAYLGMSRAQLRQGKWADARSSLDLIQKEFPESFESVLAKEMAEQGFFFTVQVGSFSTREGATLLTRRLRSLGQSPYILEYEKGEKTLFRVRVGKLDSRSQATRLERELRDLGFDTAIAP
ncbi:MAG: SPOR domain-containing protein [Candidatus Omnitrophica bacterium]|nr:SPOR domain-containing protein [Candidatus Omnitrophota bacterium]